MSVSEVLGGLGKWDVTLSPELPEEVRSQLGAFGHIVIVRGDLGADPTSYGDALLRSARYVGLCYDVGKGDDRTLSGVSLEAWLGDEDDKGAVFETPVTITNGTLAAWLAALLPASSGITPGVVNAPVSPATVTDTIQWLSPRKAVDRICKAFGVEYVVRFDGTLDVGTQAQLYRSLPRTDGTPAPMVRRREGGTDLDAVALGGALQAESSAKDFSTRIVLVGETDDQTGQFAISSGSLPALSVPFFDLHGNRIVRTRLISSSQETTATGPATVALNLNRFGRLTTSLKITADGYELEGTFAVGDLCYVYDPDTGLVDPSREVLFRGVPIHPQIIRISEISWSVTSDHTVLFRTTAGAWIDLTRWVVWESGSNDLTVGDLPRTLTSGGANPVLDRADANTGRGDVPAAPTGLSLTTDAFTDPRTGANSAIVRATWTAPTQNTDATPLLDLALYRVQFRPTFRAPQWNETSTVSTTIDLPAVTALGYDVRVAAVDKSGNVGAFTAVASITTAADPTAPPAPADPTVSNYRGQARIVYSGRDSLGAIMPSDANRVDVEWATASGGPWTAYDSLTPFAEGVSYRDVPNGTTQFFRLRAYDHAGNVSPASGVISFTGAQIANGDISSLAVGKLTAGVMTADVTVSGRFATALTGARREMNATGFQAWDAANNLLINLDGVNNLLTGQYRTALSGRRIEMGSAGTAGQIYFISPDGVTMRLQAFTATVGDPGTEAIRMGMLPTVATIWPGWGSIQVENPGEYWAWLPEYTVVVGGNGAEAVGEKAFYVSWATTRGTASANPARASRLYVGVDQNNNFYPVGGSFGVYERNGDLASDLTYNRLQITDSDVWFRWVRTDEGRLLIRPRSNTNGANASPAFQMVNKDDTGVLLKAYADVGGVNPRLEVRNVVDTAATPVYASAFTTVSSERTKKDIAGIPYSAREKLRSLAPKTFRVLGANSSADRVEDGPVQLGLIAEEVPAEIAVHGDDGVLGYDLAALVALLLRYVQEIDDRLSATEKRIGP